MRELEGFIVGDKVLGSVEVGSAVGITDWVRKGCVEGTSLGVDVVGIVDGEGD